MKDSKIKIQSSEKRSNVKSNSTFDLEERLASFGVQVIVICKDIPVTTINRPLISQIVRSATSIGANYSEANNASSRRDFRNKVFIAKKEAQETKHWLKMLSAAAPEFTEQLKTLARENHELCLILQSIINKTREDT